MDYERLRKMDAANSFENRLRAELKSFPAPLNDDAIIGMALMAFEDLWEQAFAVGYDVGWTTAHHGFPFESYPTVGRAGVGE